MEKTEFPIPCTFDISETQSEITSEQSRSPQTNDEQLSFPKHGEDSNLTKPNSMTPDSLSAQDSPDDQIAESSSVPEGSGSPQLDQLLSELQEMKLKFRPMTLDIHLSESSDESPKVHQMYKFEDFASGDQYPSEHTDPILVSLSSVVQLAEDANCMNLTITEPAHFQASAQGEPELHLDADPTTTPKTSIPSSLKRCEDSPTSSTTFFSIPESPKGYGELIEPTLNSASEILQTSHYNANPTEACSLVSFPNVLAQSQSDILGKSPLELNNPPNDSVGVAEGLSTQSAPDQHQHLERKSSIEAIHTDDISSQSLPDLTPVLCSRNFSVNELMAYHSPNLERFSFDDRQMVSRENFEKSLTPVEQECFVPQSLSVINETETPSSPLDEDDSIPPDYAECSSAATAYTHIPPGYTEVLRSKAETPIFEYSDPESYFDCKQVESDFSEAEPDESEKKNRMVGGQNQDRHCYPAVLEKTHQTVLLSSDSEDYEDAPLVQEPFQNVQKKGEELRHYSETSDEEFTLCEAYRPVYKFQPYDETKKSLTRVR